MRALALLLLASCAHAHTGEWVPADACRPWPGVVVANESELSCGTIASAFDRAASIAEAVGVSSRLELEGVAREVAFVIIDTPRLYVNRHGKEVAGFMACDALPRVILDRTLQGLLHELLHARDCVSGQRQLDAKAWKEFWALGEWR